MSFDLTGLPLFDSRDGALDALEIAREDYVTAARKVALRLLETRETITINDVREMLPPPANVDPRVMGAVLRQPLFLKVGYAQSDRKACHSRPIALFRLGDA
jgi:hypothetical protein